MKNVAYAPEYVDRLVTEKDIVGLLTLIEIRERVSPPPKAALLFRGLIYWTGAIRSGLYQYYEGRLENDPELASFAELFAEFGFTDVADYYLRAYKIWHDTADPEALSTIEEWIDENEDRLLERAVSFLATAQSFLKNNDGA